MEVEKFAQPSVASQPKAASCRVNERPTASLSTYFLDLHSFPILFAFAGYVCALRLYDRALTTDEIAYNAMLDALRFGEENDCFRWNSMTQKLEIYEDVTCLGASGGTVALNGGTAARAGGLQLIVR